MYCAIPSIAPVRTCPTFPAHPANFVYPGASALPSRARAIWDGGCLRGVGASDGTEAGVALVEDLESGVVSVV